MLSCHEHPKVTVLYERDIECPLCERSEVLLVPAGVVPEIVDTAGVVRYIDEGLKGGGNPWT